MTLMIPQKLYQFLQPRWKPNMALLVGFSGGPDSLALLHGLLSLRQRLPFRLALAHVDHGWRPESRDEAEQIRVIASELGVEAHIWKLPEDTRDNNREAACREARYRFFAMLCKEQNYDAVLVAHHADDMAETVLKRTFEGASLPKLQGIREECIIENVRVWRPFLSIPKQTILQWLEDRSLKGFYDSTNDDPAYLRARMRQRLVPDLEEAFGKNVKTSLCALGKESQELKNYLDVRIEHFLKEAVKGPWGIMLDVPPSTHSYEAKHVIRTLCEQQKMSLSREALENAVRLLSNGAAHKYITKKPNEKLYVDRRRLFLVRAEQPLTWNPLEWEFRVESIEKNSEEAPSGWRDLWQGEMSVILAETDFALKEPYAFMKSLDSKLTEFKVPALLRHAAPVVVFKDQLLHEFLTGKRQSKSTYPRVKISLKRAYTEKN